MSRARRAALFIAAATTVLACRPQAPERPAEEPAPCVPGARFHGALYGELATELDWRDAALRCEGMPRPHDAGARLRFAGSAGGGGRKLAFIVALPDLKPGGTANELPATVTVIAEDDGRFFSNAEQPGCWSDVTEQQPLDAAAASFAVTGIVYCLTPLAELGGSGSVRIGEFGYTGRIDWGSDD